MRTILPRTSRGSSERPRRMAASMPVYSAAWIPAVTSTDGPACAPLIAMYGQRYFARPGSPSKVKVPLAREDALGTGIGPMSISVHPQHGTRDPAQRGLLAPAGSARGAFERLDRRARVEIVVERGEHRARRGVAPERTDRAASERAREAIGPLARAGETSVVVVERATVVRVEQVEPQRLRRRGPQRVAHEHHVAERLRHLLAAEAHRSGMHPPSGERTLPGGRLRLRDLVLVMRIDEVAPAAVDVDAIAEMAERHRRALEMPSGAAGTVPARPGRTAGDGAPQCEVDRAAAARIVERGVVLTREDRAHPRRTEPRELAVPRIARDVVVHAAVDNVRGAAAPQPLDERAHGGELARRVRQHVGAAPAQRAHVLEELALLTPAEGAPVDAVAGRALEDGFVDIGDVLRVPDACSPRLEKPHQHVEDEERARVAEVGRVVGRHAADVDGDGGGAGTERRGAPATRVVEGEHLG